PSDTLYFPSSLSPLHTPTSQSPHVSNSNPPLYLCLSLSFPTRRSSDLSRTSTLAPLISRLHTSCSSRSPWPHSSARSGSLLAHRLVKSSSPICSWATSQACLKSKASSKCSWPSTSLDRPSETHAMASRLLSEPC